MRTRKSIYVIHNVYNLSTQTGIKESQISIPSNSLITLKTTAAQSHPESPQLTLHSNFNFINMRPHITYIHMCNINPYQTPSKQL